ncbi:MAG: 23S rRNA (uracil(1939)-C(5))-methyltransferase RlmD [Deferrisomatales bacterium]
MEAIVRDITLDGEGLVAVGGRELVVPGALPGDAVRLDPAGGPPAVVRRARRPEGSPCPHRSCPGCPLLALPYPEQLELKGRLAKRLLSRHLSPEGLSTLLPVRPSPRPLGYRASAKLAVARHRRGIALGLYRRGTHAVVDIPRCPVHRPLLARGVRALRALLARAPALAAPGPGARGWLRYAAFQESGARNTLVVTLVTHSGDRPEILQGLAARLREGLPELQGVAWNVNPSPGNEIFGEEWREVWGTCRLLERLGDVDLEVSPGSFLQVNREQAGWAYRTALAWLDPQPGEAAADLYCGVGSLALHLAARAGRVVGIEGSPGAVADARRNAEACGAGAVEFRAGRVEESFPALLAEGFRPQLVTLNPARKGVAPEGIEAIRAASPRAVTYLSCHPETLGRDAAALCAGGAYALERLQPADFFPHTGHVETLALFRRREAG